MAARPRRRSPRQPPLTLRALLEHMPELVAAWEAASHTARATQQQTRVDSRTARSRIKASDPDSPGLQQVRANLAAGKARADDLTAAAHGVPCTQRALWREAHGRPPLTNGAPPPPPLATHGSVRRPDGTPIPRSKEWE